MLKRELILRRIYHSGSYVDNNEKIRAALIHSVYQEADFGFSASLFCALVVLLGFLSREYNERIFIWFGLYLFITVFRFILVRAYKLQYFPQQNYQTWRRLYIFGAGLAGISWGAAVALLPTATPQEQVLVILMLAGVSAGALPLNLGIPLASIIFSVTAITPFIVYFALSSNLIYILFSSALTLYLIYSIVLTIKGERTIKKSVELQFENANLLQNLSEAKYQLEITNEKLEYAATHDPLTHVSNRSLFQVNLEKAIHYASVHKKMFALFYLDLDRFKSINDAYGHDAGDSVLVIITNRLIHFFHANEDIARLGGEEFTIIIKEIKSLEEVQQIAEDLCNVIAEPIVVKNIGKVFVTASVGISIFPLDGHTPQMLLSQADKWMYCAKEHGGNLFYFTNSSAYENETLKNE